PLSVELHDLPVIICPSQKLLLRSVVRRKSRELLLTLVPNRHRIHPHVIAIFARHIEPGAVLPKRLQEGSRNLHSALVVHLRRIVATKHSGDHHVAENLVRFSPLHFTERHFHPLLPTILAASLILSTGKRSLP